RCTMRNLRRPLLMPGSSVRSVALQSGTRMEMAWVRRATYHPTTFPLMTRNSRLALDQAWMRARAVVRAVARKDGWCRDEHVQDSFCTSSDQAMPRADAARSSRVCL